MGVPFNDSDSNVLIYKYAPTVEKLYPPHVVVPDWEEKYGLRRHCLKRGGRYYLEVPKAQYESVSFWYARPMCAPFASCVVSKPGHSDRQDLDTPADVAEFEGDCCRFLLRFKNIHQPYPYCDYALSVEGRGRAPFFEQLFFRVFSSF